MKEEWSGGIRSEGIMSFLTSEKSPSVARPPAGNSMEGDYQRALHDGTMDRQSYFTGKQAADQEQFARIARTQVDERKEVAITTFKK